MNLKAFLAALIGIQILVAGACTTALATQGKAAKDAPLTAEEQKIYDKLAPYVRTLSREIYIFHYEINYGKTISELKPWDINHLRSQAANFSDWKASGGNAGPGYYAALDPIGSETWGGGPNRFVLFVTKLSLGTKFLVNGSGIEVHRLNGFSKLEDMASLNKVVAKLGVAGFFYYWDSIYQFFQSNPCINGQSPSLDFLVIDPKVLTTENTVLLTPKRDNHAHDSLREIISYQFTQIKNGSTGTEKISHMPHGLWPKNPQTTEPQNWQAWMREHAFGCGDYPEDK